VNPETKKYSFPYKNKDSTVVSANRKQENIIVNVGEIFLHSLITRVPKTEKIENLSSYYRNRGKTPRISISRAKQPKHAQ
jgi:hypothetical protein